MRGLPFVGDRSELRRLSGVHAYIGPGGSGKSLAMVHDTLASLAQGRPVFSTVRLIDADGNDHPLWRPFEDWMQLTSAECRECDLLLDEAVGSASSHEWQAMPIQARNVVVQSRRLDLVMRVSSHQFSDIEKSIRGATQAVTVCKAFLPKVVPGRLFPQRRLFRWTTFDSRDWQDVSESKVSGDSKNRRRPLATQFFWRPGSRAETAYDTLAPVIMVRHVSQAGICGNCGGKRSMPRCTCDKPRSGNRTAPLPAETGKSPNTELERDRDGSFDWMREVFPLELEDDASGSAA